MRALNFIVAPLSVFAYLFTMMGVGRYSCHCDHSSHFALFGIVTQCACTDMPHYEDPDHRCICGAHLEAEQPKRDDCCSVAYFFLEEDQNFVTSNDDIIHADNILVLPLSTVCNGVSMIQRTRIKNFEALFRSDKVPLYEMNSQLIL